MSTQLNYHHLRYFREVATLGHLGQAAGRLNVSQSALSMQIRTLEERIGHALFNRVGRKLILTEAGKIALDHANRIFGTGDELIATLRHNTAAQTPLRVGALSTLSRNLQLQFLRPILKTTGNALVLKSGPTDLLLQDLQDLALDVVLTTQAPGMDVARPFAAQRIAEQAVQIHGTPERLNPYQTLADLLTHVPVILPTDNIIRTGFTSLASRLGITPHICATVDDMAMVRLLAREGAGLAIAPAVVLADEIGNGRIQTAPFELGIVEPFFAVTLPRKFPHPALAGLLGQ